VPRSRPADMAPPPGRPHLCCTLNLADTLELGPLALRDISARGVRLRVDLLIPAGLEGVAQFFDAPGRAFCQREVRVVYEGNNGVSGPVVHSRASLEIADEKVTFEYKVEVAPAGKQAPREIPSIKGKALDLDEGRVVLVDLSAKGPETKQVSIDLPESPAWPTKTDQV
jgi:hypothetical protein